MKKQFNSETRKNTTSIDSNLNKATQEFSKIKNEIMNNKKDQNEINHKIINKFDDYTITTDMTDMFNKKVETVREELLSMIKWNNTEQNRKIQKIIKESLTVPGLVEEFNPDAPY